MRSRCKLARSGNIDCLIALIVLVSGLRFGLIGHRASSWPVAFEFQAQRWAVWLHAVRKSALAAQHAKEQLQKERGSGIQAATLELAEYVMVLSSLGPHVLSPLRALALYRGRWQIELVFKRVKSLLGIEELV